MLILIRHRIAPAPGEMGYCYIHPLPLPRLPLFPPPCYHSPYPVGTSYLARRHSFHPPTAAALAPTLMHTRKCPFAHFCLRLLLWEANFLLQECFKIKCHDAMFNIKLQACKCVVFSLHLVIFLAFLGKFFLPRIHSNINDIGFLFGKICKIRVLLLQARLRRALSFCTALCEQFYPYILCIKLCA